MTKSCCRPRDVGPLLLPSVGAQGPSSFHRRSMLSRRVAIASACCGHGSRTRRGGRQWGLSPSGQTWALSAWKRGLGQTRTQTEGCAERRARGWPGWGWRGQQGVRLHIEEGTGGPLQAWGVGVPSLGATSHQLGFCIKLEILDGLVVLDACLQFHHLVLKLNMAPIRGHRRRESAAPGAAPSQPFGAGGTLPREGPGPWMGAGSITLPSDKAEFRATLSRVTVDVPQHPGVHVRAPTGTLRGRGVQSQQQDAWFHEPYPHPPGGVLDLSLPGGGKSAWPLPPPSVPAQGTVASLPWISAILRPGLPSLSSCTEDSRAASTFRRS